MAVLTVAELRGVINLQDNFSGPIDKVAKALGVSGESFRAVTGFAGLAAAAIGSATAAIVVLGQRGAQVADVDAAFEGLSQRVGSTGDAMLGALQQGTLNTISNFELMKMANQALGTGLVRSAADMETLGGGAKLLADRVGGETSQAMDALTSAMNTGRTAGLGQLGMYVDNKAAIEDYAKGVNKTAEDLSGYERKVALSQAVMAALKRELQEAGPATVDFADRIDQAKAFVQNLTDQLGVAIATSPVLSAGFDAVAGALQSAFGGGQQDTVKLLQGLVADFAIGLTYVAQGAVAGAAVFVTAWYAVKTVVLGVITAVSGVTAAVVTLVDAAVDIAAKIPGASSVLGDLAGVTEDFRLRTEGATLALASETAEAARGIVGNSELHRTLDAVGGAVMTVRDAMTAARDSSATLNEANEGTRQGLDTLGASATATGQSYWEMMEVAAEAYNRMWELAQEVGQQEMQLRNEIALANTSGLDQKLLQIEQERQAELTALQEKLVMYPEIYEELAGLVTEKYRLMGDAARGFHADIVVQANNAGFQTRAQLEQTAANAIDTYNRMKESGQFTAQEMQRAWEAMETAKRNASNMTFTSTTQGLGAMLTATSQALQSFGVSYKAAAVAGAILSSISAIQKAWASAPFPANLPAVATVTAATVANIMAIRSASPGFAMGTVGTRFEDFGRESFVALHGQEAVVTRSQATSVAGMVEEALQLQDARTVEELRGLREDLADDRKRMKIAIRDAVLLAV